MRCTYSIKRKLELLLFAAVAYYRKKRFGRNNELLLKVAIAISLHGNAIVRREVSIIVEAKVAAGLLDKHSVQDAITQLLQKATDKIAICIIYQAYGKEPTCIDCWFAKIVEQEPTGNASEWQVFSYQKGKKKKKKVLYLQVLPNTRVDLLHSLVLA